MNRLEDQRPYLFVMAAPTPNGRLHLGHINGPYLTADIVRRERERNGERCISVSGVDSLDAYVDLAAERERIAPEALCLRNAAGIQRDLSRMEVLVDYFFDPLEPENAALLTETTEHWLARLEQKKLLARSIEALPVRSNGEYVGSARIRGLCPQCGQEAGGFGCEACFGRHRPADLSERGAVDGTPLADRSFELLGALPGDQAGLAAYLERTGLAPEFQSAVLTSFRRSDGRMRLSIPDVRGTAVPSRYGVTPQVVHTASQLLPFVYAILRRLEEGASGEPCAVEALDMIRFAGGDGAVSHALGGWLAEVAELPTYRALVVNHFYFLAGKKFSTSRRHAIWVEDAVEILALPVDALRLYLATTSPLERATDFSPQGFVDFYHEVFVARLNSLLDAPASRCPVGGIELEEIERELQVQHELLNRLPPETGSTARALVDWIRTRSAQPSRRNALGFAVLASPFMPRTARAVWQALGYPGQPRIAFLHTIPDAAVPTTMPRFSSLTEEQQQRLVACQPGEKAK